MCHQQHLYESAKGVDGKQDGNKLHEQTISRYEKRVKQEKSHLKY